MSRVQNASTISLNPNGSIVRRTGLGGQAGASTGFVYDGRSLLRARTDPLGRSAGFGYGINEEILSMTDSLGTTSYGYDAAGRLVAQTDPHGFTVGYGYDAAGNLTSITYPGDKTVTYGYDALNRLTTVTDWRGGVAQYFYDAAGRLMLQINPNGTFTNFGYDTAGRLTSLINRRGNGTIIASQSFALDPNGNRTREQRREPEVPWSLPTETVAMDFNATRTRLLEAGTDTFAYDDEGQLIDRAGTGLTFDHEHRLTAIGPGNVFAYDGVGNRLRAARDGQVTRYVYDQAGNLLAEADQSNQITRYYVHGLGLIGLIEGQDAYQYHFDALGSTVALTDAGGEIVNAYTYSPYGRVANQTEGLSQPFQYVGQYGVMAEPAGLYYMRARYYDPEVGRFISEDPIGFEGGLNLYAYVGGNPVNGIDPEGTLVVNAIGGFIGGVAGGVGACLDGCDFTDALIGFGTGAAAGAISPLTVARTVGATFVRGAALGGSSNLASQSITISLDANKTFAQDFNIGALVGSAAGGGAASALTRPFGTSVGEQISSGIFSFAPTNAATLVGQSLGK